VLGYNLRKVSMELRLKENLEHLIDESGISITNLAKKCGINQQTIHNWLSGQSPKNISQVKKLADYFGCSIEDICFLDNKTGLKSEIDKYKEEINAGIFEVILRRVQK